jgi:hypothetical protein
MSSTLYYAICIFHIFWPRNYFLAHDKYFNKLTELVLKNVSCCLIVRMYIFTLLHYIYITINVNYRFSVWPHFIFFNSAWNTGVITKLRLLLCLKWQKWHFLFRSPHTKVFYAPHLSSSVIYTCTDLMDNSHESRTAILMNGWHRS